MHAADTHALVLKHDTFWDRFGTRLRDMPFLNSFFENPVIGKFFEETESAKSLRLQLHNDPSFSLDDLSQTMEYIIAPKILYAYLSADDQFLKLHCGEAAYNMCHSTIVQRQREGVQLHKDILLLWAVQHKGGQVLEVPHKGNITEKPCFVWTFSTQQINCLKNKKGEVVQGAIDDIREVHYALVLASHPEPSTPGLLFPWVVTELAIVGNVPVW
eukprot:GHVR01007852.1.p1 GENE.GHVR01007852.1~~GHVR01007852.1.p1  ORF type:complete len:215 (+),score=52.77 GHVR01007852.1:174-818(+)